MKRLIKTCSLFALLLVMMASAQAQSAKQYRVRIPFDFSIGQEFYQAGTYQLTLNKFVNLQSLTIRNQKTNSAKTLITLPEKEEKQFKAPQFYFKRSGNQNVLVEIAGNDFNVKFSEGVREVASDMPAPPAAHR